MPRFVSAHVTQLLGEFTHDLYLLAESDFVIMYGPNGIGKTRFLELIAAIIRLRDKHLLAMPFERAQVRFDHGSIEVVRQDLVVPGLELILRDRFDKPVASWTPSAEDRNRSFYARIEDETSYTQVGPDTWEDTSDGELITEATLRRRFRTLAEEVPESEAPPAFADFCLELKVHVIETQRLVTSHRAAVRRATGNAQRPTVLAYADDLKRRLGQALAANSKTTQQLDRTFPRRILLDPSVPEAGDDDIRRRYNEQNELRKRLAAIALIDSEADLPLPGRRLEDFERRVLWTYLEDTERKLATFQQVLDKVTLLQDVMNSRLLRKKLKVDGDAGLRVVRHSDRGDIALDELSSGEQHELVLVYDLLFNVTPGTLVLVDEPEISLHVAWQQRFVGDIIRISELVTTQFIIATHSPQIIGKWWDRTVELSVPDA